MTTIVPGLRTALGRHLRELQVILASAPARAAAVVTCTIPAATSGPPLHFHAASDEIFFILSGELLVHADGHVATIREGGLVHVSCGMPHTFATTAMPCVTGRAPGLRPGRGRISPSAVAVSGPVLPAPYLREEDPCVPWLAAGP